MYHSSRITFQNLCAARVPSSSLFNFLGGLQTIMSKKWVYLFNEVDEVQKLLGGDWDKVRGLLGGKGANLGDMVRAGLPVPAGFTVTTEACNAYLAAGEKFPAGMWEEEVEGMKAIE